MTWERGRALIRVRPGGGNWPLFVLALATVGCTVAVSTPPRHEHGAGVSPRTGVRRTIRLGTSVRGRPVTAIEIGDPGSRFTVLVVGCIHGDERAGIAITNALARGPAPAHADLWIIPVLDPDGAAARTRGNARGVDLNRNFPDRWQPIGHPGTTYFAGAGPLSEPESRLAAALIRRIRPSVGIWFHQHMAVVDDSEGPKDVEQRFARQVGLPERPLTDYPGSATGWENTVVPDSAFVVELPAGSLSPPDMRRYVAAVQTILHSAAARPDGARTRHGARRTEDSGASGSGRRP